MRKLAIGTALTATLLACYFAPDEEVDMIAPAQARALQPAAAAPLAAPATDTLLEIRPRTEEEDLGNAFARHSWQDEPAQAAPKPADSSVTKPAQARAATAVLAGAPQLPIRLLGRFIDDGKAAYFLQIDERNVVAYVGDRIDDSYTFDSAGPDTLTFTYLPLQQRQVLAVGDMN